MANTGLLILTNPAAVTKLLPVIKKHVLKTLYVQYFPEKAAFAAGTYGVVKQPFKGPGYAKTVANIYTVTSSISSYLDIRVLLSTLKNPRLSIINTKRPVEVVIFDQVYSKKEADIFIQDYLSNTSMGCKAVIFQDEQSAVELRDPLSNMQEGKLFKNVVLGGTFDRLHNGHKIFLSEAALHCTEKLTVGVTDVNMLYGKLLWELIEPCSKRILAVKDFLEDVDFTIQNDVVPINDAYGPTKDDPNFDLLVVSEETRKGGDKVNEKRAENNLNKLEIHVIPLLHEEHRREHEESKISSSNRRIRLLGTHLKPPVRVAFKIVMFNNLKKFRLVKDLFFQKLKHKSARPYIIGLTGGIASGKSSVAEKIGELGAGVVDCDKLAHELYLPGKNCYEAIVKTFGSSILKPDGSIDRKALGNIVFHDKVRDGSFLLQNFTAKGVLTLAEMLFQTQLNTLNKLVWPMILDEAKKRINDLYMKGFNIIVMEAAVLIQAKWYDTCDEIWTCIIPQEEAIKRVMERNGVTEAEAKLRINVQPSNVEQVSEANVVICTLWDHDITREQVRKGWDELMMFLSDNSNS